MRAICAQCDDEALFGATTCYRHLEDAESWTRRAVEQLRTHGAHDIVMTGALLDGIDLRGANLEFAQLAAASLRGADLRDADLSRAKLAGADLSDARLDGAQLQMINGRRLVAEHATLANARLNGATLASARLRGCDLRQAELVGANLRGADLRDATLAGATLHRTSLAGADVTGCDFRDAVLRDVSMIDTVGFDESPDGVITTDRMDREPRSVRPSTMKWRHWTEADEPRHAERDDDVPPDAPA